MKIIKKVEVKQIITEDSKAKIKLSFDKQKMQLEQECQQLLFEKKKMLHRKVAAKQEIEHRFHQEISKREEKIKLIEFKEEQLDILDYGSEIVEGEVESLVEVRIGTNWEELMKNQSIVIKDNVIVRIDE